MKSYLMFYALADAVLGLQLGVQRMTGRAVKALIATHEALRRAGHAQYARTRVFPARSAKDEAK